MRRGRVFEKGQMSRAIKAHVNFTEKPRLLGPPSAVFRIFFPPSFVLPGMSTDHGSRGQRRAYELGGPKERNMTKHTEAVERVCCEHGMYCLEDDV